MTDALPDTRRNLSDNESETRACDWSDYRKDHGEDPDPNRNKLNHLYFTAGWGDGRRSADLSEAAIDMALQRIGLGVQTRMAVIAALAGVGASIRADMGRTEREPDAKPDYDEAIESDDVSYPEEPVEDRLQRAFLNGFVEGVHRAAYGNRWDHS